MGGDQELKRKYSLAPVYFKGTALKQACSPVISPAHLGRQLQEQVFGSDGIVDDMI